MSEVTPQDVALARPDQRAGAAILAQAETIAENKTKLAPGRAFALAILAGLMIGSGATFMLIVKADATLTFAPSQVLGGLCFALGLICVIVAGAELFTGNALMVCAAADKRISWGALIKNWLIVYAGNLVGSLLLVLILVLANTAGMNGGAFGDAAVNVAYSKISLSPLQIIFRGVLCNWLVCLAVWMGFAGRTVVDKIFTAIFPVMAFVACGFEHCVANMFFLPMGVATLATSGMSGDIAADRMAALLNTVTATGACYNIVLATVGNILGGAVLVGFMYWLSYRKKES